MNKKFEWTIGKIVGAALGALILIFTLSMSGKMFEDNNAGEILIVQDWYDGELHVYTTPGMKEQWGGSCTHYKKSFQYWFDGNQKADHFKLIPTKFYDGGHASLPGSARIDLPLDEQSLIKIHTKFGSQEAIETQLIGQTLIKAVSMSGPLMSSKESYAEKKNNLVYYIEDQAANGIYKTTQKDIKTLDPLTNTEKVVTVVEIINDSKNLPLRQEHSLLKELNIQLTNLSLGDFEYDDVVKKQIAAQQEQTMKVQTGISNAKRAEQDAITAEQQGKADAAKAKWSQEVIKAQKVTQAQQELEVQLLATKTAASYKEQQILEGQGEAAKKQLLMQANGALEQKLDAWVKVNKFYADAMSNSNWVPTTIMGGNAGTMSAYSSGAMNLIDLMTAKTAQDLNLNFKSK